MSGRYTPAHVSTYPYLDSSVGVYLDEYVETICPETLAKHDVIPLLMENLTVQTAYLKSPNQRPISLLFLGRAGIGKTRLFTPLSKLKEASYVNDITPKYLVEFLSKVKNGEKAVLAIPDFIHCMSHARATRAVLTSILRSMTEEGVKDLSDYHLEFRSERPIKAGLITAVTKASYGEFAIDWKRSGFLSRLLPFSYDHSPSTQETIMDFIERREPDLIHKVKLKIKRNPHKVEMPGHLLRQLRAYEEMLGKSSGSTPYRHQIQLIGLTEALAILRDEKEITQEDIDIIAHLCRWMNYDFNAI
jgi:hypothetical protein